jgi:hypothetical protein
MSSCAGFRAFGVNMIQFMSITMQVLTYAVTICTIIRRMRTGIKWLEKLRFLDEVLPTLTTSIYIMAGQLFKH